MTLNVAWVLVSDELVLSITGTADLQAQPSLAFTENDLKRRKYAVSSRCVDEKRRMGLLVDMIMIERQETQGVQNTISEDRTRIFLSHLSTNHLRTN